MIREEERVQKEAERAKLKAEKEEKRHQMALEQARKEVQQATDEQRALFEAKVMELEEQLTEAQKEKERAISMAQLTKSGHVYVISNIGSFGKDIYKIGMTRRLEPMDRVKELGDASVPFSFDVHAMVYSENAPELESNLHNIFDSERMNLVNRRKEFFQVSLDDVETAVKELGLDIEFTKLAEAQQYYESENIRNQEELVAAERKRVLEEFPASL